MSRTVFGYDREEDSVSTPVSVPRGSATVLRRQCRILNHDTRQEEDLNISAATAIRWAVTVYTQPTSSEILSKTLAAGGIALVSGGSTGTLDITLTAADTKALTPGCYLAELAVTLTSGFYKFKSYRFTISATQKLAE